MLQLSLLPALFAPTFAPSVAPALSAAAAPILCAEELSRALPNDAVEVLLVGELDAQLFGDGAGQWASFLLDARWIDVLVSLAESAGDDIESARQALATSHSALRGLSGGALAFDYSGDEVRGVLRVDEGWWARFGARAEELGGALVETTCLGRPAFSGPTEGDTGAVLIVDGGEHVFIAARADVAAATATIGTLIGALEAAAEDDTERWWLASDARIAGASIEVFANLGATMSDSELEEFTATLGAPGVGYGAFALGAGTKAEWFFSADFDGGPVMQAMTSSFVTADTALFGFVPEGYSGTVIGLDVLAAIEELLVFAEETTPGASTDYDQGLEAISGLLGVDLEEDLLAHLTGQILMLQPATDLAAIAEQGEESAVVEALLPVFGFGIGDVDAVVGVLEALFGALAAQGVEAETAEIAGGSLWTFDPGFGMTIAVAAGSGFLAIGAEQGAVDLLAQAAQPNEARAAATKELAAVASDLDGCLVSAVTIAAIIESFAATDELMSTLGAEDEEIALIGEVMGALVEIAGEHLSGLIGGELRFTTKRMSYRVLSR